MIIESLIYQKFSLMFLYFAILLRKLIYCHVYWCKIKSTSLMNFLLIFFSLND